MKYVGTILICLFFCLFSLVVPALAASNAKLCAIYLSGRRQILDRSFVTENSKVKVAFFDADSTLRKSKSRSFIVTGANDVEILPGVIEKIKEVASQGYLIAIVSNQGGIPKQISFENADQGLFRTIEMLREQGAVIHYYDFAEAKNANRKPGDGMAKNLQRVLDMDFPEGVKIDYRNSFMVGDAAYKKGETRPDGTKGNDFSNSDRLFAEKIKVPFEEARYFFGWKKPKAQVAKKKTTVAKKTASGKRAATAISVNELEKKITTALAKKNKKKGTSEEDEESEDEAVDLKTLTADVKKDLSKVKFDKHAFTVFSNDQHGIAEIKGMVGYRTLSNGLSFLGVVTEPEDELPLFFIIYWDGKKLRAYIPTEGNLWDTDKNKAYSPNYDHRPNLRKRFPRLESMLKEKLDLDSPVWAELKFDERALSDDIEARIRVK